jgi:hypothetical protein
LRRERKRGGGCWVATPQIEIGKHRFCRHGFTYLSFSQRQSLKSADDNTMEFFKTILKTHEELDNFEKKNKIRPSYLK